MEETLSVCNATQISKKQAYLFIKKINSVINIPDPSGRSEKCSQMFTSHIYIPPFTPPFQEFFEINFILVTWVKLQVLKVAMWATIIIMKLEYLHCAVKKYVNWLCC